LKKLFQVDVALIATAYILADSEEEAQKMAMDKARTGIEFSGRRQEIGEDLFMTGEVFSPDMPEFSLSPAMTFGAPQGKAYLTEEFEEEDNGVHGLTGVHIN
jgi:hypothetical protein